MFPHFFLLPRSSSSSLQCQCNMCTPIKCSMWKEQTPTTPPVLCRDKAVAIKVFALCCWICFWHIPLCFIQSFQHLFLHRHPTVHPDDSRPVLWGSASLRLTGLHTWHTSNRLSDCWYNRGRVHVCGSAHQRCSRRSHCCDNRGHHKWCRGRGRNQRWHSRQLRDPGGLHAERWQQRRQQQQQ